MPIISTFFGIVIRMYYSDHAPPHFHAEYQGQRATFDFTGRLLAGDMRLTPPNSGRTGRTWRRGGPSSGSSPWSEVAVSTLPCVVKAEYRGAHRIHVWFDDGREKTLDFAQWLKGPVFEPLKDQAYFSRFFLDGGPIGWPNGADIAPETLYAAQGVEEAA